MIVDAHVHILPDSIRNDIASVYAQEQWFADCHAGGKAVASVESLIQYLDTNEIDTAVCLGWPFAQAQLCAEMNDYVAAAQKQFPGRIVGFGIVQPADPGAAAEVERCARLGLRGIGELNADAQGFALSDQALLQPVIDATRACGLLWNLHCSEPVGHLYAGKGTTTPDAVVSLAMRNPELQLICAHLGGGLPLYGHMPEIHQLCQRLWFDTAAQPFVYKASAYRAIADSVGVDRLLFGSDHPLLDLPRYRQALNEAQLDSAVQAAILGDNAARLLGLS